MRSPHPTRAHLIGAVVLGVAAALLAPLSPAAGGITTLCAGYGGCQSKGMGSAGYAKANDRMYWRMYSGHNCTNYVAYRMVRKGMPNRRPWNGGGNATYWGTEMPRKTNQRPAVGSVAWWKAGTSRGGSSGHVAYVERVISPSEIVVSQDAWGGNFSWARITKGYGWPNGFIHLKDTPLRGLERPRVTGAPRVGVRLQATRGSWKPRPAAVTYRWFVDGDRVKGADSRTLRLDRHMIGDRVRVVAVARRYGYPRTVTPSRLTGKVGRGLFSVSRSPELSGRARAGRTLHASAGSWSPRAQQVSFRWFADGERIRKATSSSLRLGAGLVHARIAVEVTARRRGYEPATRTLRASHRVAPGRLHVERGPRLVGEAQRGHELRVRLGQSDPTAEVRRVRWLRDGRVVKGATSRIYHLGRADLGHRLRAEVRYRRAGYRTLTDRSALSMPVKTTPRVSVTKERTRRGVRLVVIGKGARRPLTTGVRVTYRGELVDRATMRRGKAVVSLKGLRPGERTLRVLVRATPITDPLLVKRTVRIPR
jgi:hypothetical protein